MTRDFSKIPNPENGLHLIRPSYLNKIDVTKNDIVTGEDSSNFNDRVRGRFVQRLAYLLGSDTGSGVGENILYVRLRRSEVETNTYYDIDLSRFCVVEKRGNDLKIHETVDGRFTLKFHDTRKERSHFFLCLFTDEVIRPGRMPSGGALGADPAVSNPFDATAIQPAEFFLTLSENDEEHGGSILPREHAIALGFRLAPVQFNEVGVRFRPIAERADPLASFSPNDGTFKSMTMSNRIAHFAAYSGYYRLCRVRVDTTGLEALRRETEATLFLRAHRSGDDLLGEPGADRQYAEERVRVVSGTYLHDRARNSIPVSIGRAGDRNLEFTVFVAIHLGSDDGTSIEIGNPTVSNEISLVVEAELRLEGRSAYAAPISVSVPHENKSGALVLHVTPGNDSTPKILNLPDEQDLEVPYPIEFDASPVELPAVKQGHAMTAWIAGVPPTDDDADWEIEVVVGVSGCDGASEASETPIRPILQNERRKVAFDRPGESATIAIPWNNEGVIVSVLAEADADLELRQQFRSTFLTEFWIVTPRTKERFLCFRVRQHITVSRWSPDTYLAIDLGVSAISVSFGDSLGNPPIPVPLARRLARVDPKHDEGGQDGGRGGSDALISSAIGISPFDAQMPMRGSREARPSEPTRTGEWRSRFALWEGLTSLPREKVLPTPGDIARAKDRTYIVSLPYAPASRLSNRTDGVLFSPKLALTHQDAMVRVPGRYSVWSDAEKRWAPASEVLDPKRVLAYALEDLADLHIQAASSELAEKCHGATVIMTYPNQYTEDQKALLKAQVARFCERVGSDPSKVELVSESDAVCQYYYYNRWIQVPNDERLIRILVFDMGAGTLDLSLLQYPHIHAPPSAPPQKVLARMGAAVGGNSIDTVLFAYLDQVLRLASQRVDGLELVHALGDSTSSSTGLKAETARRQLFLALKDAKREISEAVREHAARSETDRFYAWHEDIAFDVVVGSFDDPEEWPLQPNPRLPPFDEKIPLAEGITIQCVDRTIDLGASSEVHKMLVVSFQKKVFEKEGPMASLMKFACDDCVSLLLKQLEAHGATSGIDLVVVSGRASLWPMVYERLRKRLRPENSDAPSFVHSIPPAPEDMKLAVAAGAIRSVQFQRLDESDLRSPPVHVVTLVDPSDRRPEVLRRGQWLANLTPIQTGQDVLGAEKKPTLLVTLPVEMKREELVQPWWDSLIVYLKPPQTSFAEIAAHDWEDYKGGGELRAAPSLAQAGFRVIKDNIPDDVQL